MHNNQSPSRGSSLFGSIFLLNTEHTGEAEELGHGGKDRKTEGENSMDGGMVKGWRGERRQ